MSTDEIAATPVVLSEGRFSRLEAIEWWDLDRVRNARVLVVGAGALGNEVLKNLALLGIGEILVVDRDRVELSNLCRSVLFRESDEGQPKADVAARSLASLHAGTRVSALVGDVMADVGLGWFRWADVVVGALDNREARLFVNAACARLGRPWFDGGLDVLRGVVRGFAPPATACYQCTMGRVDWQIVNQRRSCSLLARRAIEHRGVPTTPTSASIIGGLQAQEVLKLLHGRDSLLGRGLVVDGETHAHSLVSYPIDPECEHHEPAPPVERVDGLDAASPLAQAWELASKRLGGLDALDLSREMAAELPCPCGRSDIARVPLEKLTAESVRCPGCGSERVPRVLRSLTAGAPELGLSARELGLPERDVIWARRGVDFLGLELGSGSANGA